MIIAEHMECPFCSHVKERCNKMHAVDGSVVSCSCERGHSGLHVACGTLDHIKAVWA
jgi:hypothetical protein